MGAWRAIISAFTADPQLTEKKRIRTTVLNPILYTIGNHCIEKARVSYVCRRSCGVSTSSQHSAVAGSRPTIFSAATDLNPCHVVLGAVDRAVL